MKITLILTLLLISAWGFMLITKGLFCVSDVTFDQTSADFEILCRFTWGTI